MNASEPTILVDRVGTDDRVARITLNRPESMNAISTDMMADLLETLHDLEADDSARVLIVRGAGRAFSTGYDLSKDNMQGFGAPHRRFRTLDDQGRHLSMGFAQGVMQGVDALAYFWSMAKITVVQLHGFCLAGGLEFAMMGDLVTASEDCVIGHPGHRGLGVARNGMALPLILGMRKAKELFYTGDGVTGVQAEQIGMINHAWPADVLEENTIALADRIANQSADFLAVLKAAANTFYENMGIRASMRSSAYFDALARTTVSSYDWQAAKDEDFRTAIRRRDAPYSDYSARPRP
jgi:enoyl-CoA hydratase